MAADQCIFIVERDAAVRAAIAAVAASLQVQTREFASGEEFLAACDSPQGGCLIAGIWLPGMSGLDLMRVLLQNGIRLPTIIIGASIDVRQAVRAMHAGAVTVLEIPFCDRELCDAIREARELDDRMKRKEAHPARVRRQPASSTRDEQRVLDGHEGRTLP